MKKLNSERITISSPPIAVADYPDCKEAVFLIAVLDEYDRKGRMIPYEAGLACHKSIIGFPIVAHLALDYLGKPADFGGHEVRTVRDGGKQEVRFGTMPIGSVTDAWIEARNVDGYTGVKNVILIRAKLWTSRYPEYFAVLDKLWEQGQVASSWELTVERAEETARGRILQAFRFIGNALLGTTHQGAVPGAGMLEYAQADGSSELALACALAKDTEIEQEEIMDNQKTVTEEKLPVPAANLTQASEPLDEIARLKAELEQKNEAIVAAGETIKLLQAQIAVLTPYKEKFEAVERERKEAEAAQKRSELRAYALKGGYITEQELEQDETMKAMIQNLDRAGIQSIIADRATAAIARSRQETAEAEAQSSSAPKANLAGTEAEDSRSLIDRYLRKFH